MSEGLRRREEKLEGKGRAKNERLHEQTFITEDLAGSERAK